MIIGDNAYLINPHIIDMIKDEQKSIIISALLLLISVLYPLCDEQMGAMLKKYTITKNKNAVRNISGMRKSAVKIIFFTRVKSSPKVM